MAVTEDIQILIDKIDRSKPNAGLTTEEAIKVQTFLNNEGALKSFESSSGVKKIGEKAIDGLFEGSSLESLTEYLNKLPKEEAGETEGYLDVNADTGEKDSASQKKSATDTFLDEYTPQYNAQKSEATNRELLRQNLKRKRDNTAVDAYNVADVGLTAYKLADAGRLRREGREDERITEGELRKRGPMGQRNPYLADALKRAVVNAEQGLSPQVQANLNRQLLNTYNTGLQAARTAGTGQAGTFGALANTASLNRMRGLSGLAQADQSARMQNQAALNNLIGQRSAEDKMLLGAEQMDFFRRRVPYLQAKLAGSAATQQAGRKQMFDTLETVPYMAGNLAKTYYNLPAQRRGDFGMTPTAQPQPQQEVAVSPLNPNPVVVEPYSPEGVLPQPVYSPYFQGMYSNPYNTNPKSSFTMSNIR